MEVLCAGPECSLDRPPALSSSRFSPPDLVSLCRAHVQGGPFGAERAGFSPEWFVAAAPPGNKFEYLGMFRSLGGQRGGY